MKLETNRLVIRPFVESDVSAYADGVADPEVMRFIGDGRPHSFDQAKQYVLGCIRNQAELGYSRYAVVLKQSNEFIGFCGYAHFNSDLDFGWRYGGQYWGNGYATEAASAVLKYGLSVLKFPLIVSICLPENVVSIRVIEKIDMDFDGHRELKAKEIVRYIRKSEGRPTTGSTVRV